MIWWKFIYNQEHSLFSVNKMVRNSGPVLSGMRYDQFLYRYQTIRLLLFCFNLLYIDFMKYEIHLFCTHCIGSPSFSIKLVRNISCLLTISSKACFNKVTCMPGCICTCIGISYVRYSGCC